MRILIVNQHSSNFGDDAAGTALVKMLLQNENVERIDIIYNAEKEIPINDKRICHNSDIKLRTAGYINVLLYVLFATLGFKGMNKCMRKWVNVIDSADIIFVAPCGANLGIYKDWRFLLRMLMIVRAGKKPIFHYNTVGKSGNRLFDFVTKYVLKNSVLYVREKQSQQYLNSIGIRCIVGPDTAFALAPQLRNVKKDTISIIPSSFDKWHPNFRKEPVDQKILDVLIPQISEWCMEKNMNVEILPHLCNVEESEFNEKVREAFIKAGLKSVIIRDDINTMWQYDETISESRIVIGMRYHSIVLAAKNSRPFISIAYENKMNEVCSYLDMQEYNWDLVGFSKGNSVPMVGLLEKAYSQEEKIEEHLEAMLRKNIIRKVKIPIERALVECQGGCGKG